MRSGGSPNKGGHAAQALGRSRGGFSTKIHVSVDALGNPLRFILTGGQQHDITQAEELIAGYAGEHVLADKGGPIMGSAPRSNRKEPADCICTFQCSSASSTVISDWLPSLLGYSERRQNVHDSAAAVSCTEARLEFHPWPPRSALRRSTVCSLAGPVPTNVTGISNLASSS